MPQEVVPNPPALPSQLPDEVLNLAVKYEKNPLDKNAAQGLKDFQQAACYIAGCPSAECL